MGQVLVEALYLDFHHLPSPPIPHFMGKEPIQSGEVSL